MVYLTVPGKSKKGRSLRRRRSIGCFVSYDIYIGSNLWRSLRLEAIARDKYRCSLCDSPDDLEVHHRRYPPFGRWDLDCLEALTTLCHDCHACVTDHLRARKYAATHGPRTEDVVRVTPIQNPGDACERLPDIEIQDHRRVTPALP